MEDFFHKHNYLFIDEDEQIPHKFYKRLDNREGTKDFQNLKSYTSINLWTTHEENKEILAKLERNIELIISEYSGNPKKRCRDINYWLDQKIIEENKDHRKELNTSCISVFNEIKWNKGKRDRICGREENPYSSEHAKLKKDLDDYCEIRDNIRCIVLKDKNECLKYNGYIRKKKQDFTRALQGICGNNDCRMKVYSREYNYNLENIIDKKLSVYIYDKIIINNIYNYKRQSNNKIIK
ncbi:hypothetical protein PVNG_02844 [Plasmodium vivax North Korean]|uniref:Uncharacterized protein n=1 Tax=Plasmodium vivax North Korean TaxID=1035514 RepID=A0A0J9TJW5_PLAVI|nr:hypothetical protein PVNG_02844 [Plasmodium vivax North Korean]